MTSHVVSFVLFVVLMPSILTKNVAGTSWSRSGYSDETLRHPPSTAFNRLRTEPRDHVMRGENRSKPNLTGDLLLGTSALPLNKTDDTIGDRSSKNKSHVNPNPTGGNPKNEAAKFKNSNLSNTMHNESNNNSSVVSKVAPLNTGLIYKSSSFSNVSHLFSVVHQNSSRTASVYPLQTSHHSFENTTNAMDVRTTISTNKVPYSESKNVEYSPKNSRSFGKEKNIPWEPYNMRIHHSPFDTRLDYEDMDFWGNRRYLISVFVPIGVGVIGATTIVVVAFVLRSFRRKKRLRMVASASRNLLRPQYPQIDHAMLLDETSDDGF